MAPCIFPPLRRRYSPSLEALRAPINLNGDELLHALLSVAHELISSSSGKEKMAFQWRNSRSLLRKALIFALLLESLKESGLVYSFTALLCFKELYLLLCRSKILLDYCFQSSKLWLILQDEDSSLGRSSGSFGVSYVQPRSTPPELLKNDRSGALVGALEVGGASAVGIRPPKAAVAALLDRLIKTPALPSLLQTLLYTGTKRARRSSFPNMDSGHKSSLLIMA